MSRLRNNTDTSDDEHDQNSTRGQTSVPSDANDNAGRNRSRHDDGESGSRRDQRHSRNSLTQIGTRPNHNNLAADAGVAIAKSFGGYFNHPATMRLAFTVLVLSLIGGGFVLARQGYRLAVLDPLGLELRENATGNGEDDFVSVGVEILDVVNVILGLLIGLSIPTCGFVGARSMQMGWLLLFMWFSLAAGIYGIVNVILAQINPDNYGSKFENCKPGEKCFATYNLLETIWSLIYLLSSYFANRLKTKITELESAIENVEDAKEVREAEIVRILVNVREEDQVTPLARPVR